MKLTHLFSASLICLFMSALTVFAYDDGDVRLLGIRGEYSAAGQFKDSGSKYSVTIRLYYGNETCLAVFRKNGDREYEGICYTDDDEGSVLKCIKMEWTEDGVRYLGVYEVRYDDDGYAWFAGEVFRIIDGKRVPFSGEKIVPLKEQ